jgi:hypothetical protein
MDISIFDFISQNFSNVVSTISLIISLFALRLHSLNTNTSLKTYLINRSNYEKGGIFLAFVCAKQLDDSFILKLVLFNPG